MIDPARIATIDTAEPATAVRRATPQNRHLFRSAYALMLNTVLTGGSGFLFWLIAAHLYAPSQVGVDGALISLMAAVSAICQLNLGNIFPRFLPESSHPARTIVVGYAAAGGLSLLAAVGTVLVAPHISPHFQAMGPTHILSAVWVGATVLWTIFALQDSALTGLRAANWIPLENGIFGIAKIAGLVLLAALGAVHGIYASWVVPMVVLIVPVNLIIFRHAVRTHTPSHNAGILGAYGRRAFYRFFTLDYLASVFELTRYAVMPILVVALLGPTDAAYYFIPYTIVLTLDQLSYNMATSLTVEGAFAADRIAGLAGAATKRFVVIMLPAIVALVIAAPLVLLPFGRMYAEHGATVLRILAIASAFRAVNVLGDAVRRVSGHGVALAGLSAIRCALTLGLTIVMAATWGLTGIAVAWLLTQIIAAALTVPLLWRLARHGTASAHSGALARPIANIVSPPSPGARAAS